MPRKRLRAERPAAGPMRPVGHAHAAAPGSPRQRLELAGMRALSDAEVLALVLGAADTTLAQQLLQTFGTLRALRQASMVDLMHQIGVGPARAAAMLAALELSSRLAAERFHLGTQIRSPQDCADLLIPQIGHLQHEEFWVVVLNTKNRVLTYYRLYQGTADSSTIRIPEVFREAIRRNAAAILVGHNHPSMDLAPSSEDLALTRLLIQAAGDLQIQLLDHLIIGASTYRSLRQDGAVKF